MNDTETTYDGNASTSRFNGRFFATAHTHTVHFLLPSDDGDHILAETGPEDNVRLTRASIPVQNEKFFSKDVLERKVQEVLPFPVYFVKRSYGCIEDDIDNPGSQVYQDMWIVHPAGDFPTVKEPLKWIHRDDVSSYRWLDATRSLRPGHTAREVEDLLEDLIWKVEARAKPWEALGFYKKLMSWALGVLESRNMVMEGRIGFLQDGDDGRMFTCAARVRDDGREDHMIDRSEVIFVKCTFPQAREVERTVAVASMVRNIVPEIFGFDAARGILMQRNAGKVTDEPLDQEALIGTVLYMQRVSVDRLPELEANGLRVMDTEWLEPNVESILSHVIFDEFFEAQESIMTFCDEERKTLKGMRSKVKVLRKMCREISNLNLPRTIVHGDCHSANIGRPTIASEGKLYRIFDWAKSHIGSPLFDLKMVLGSRPEEVGGKMNWDAGVRQVCDEWKQLACLTHVEIKNLFDDIEVLYRLIDIYVMEEQFDLYTARAEDEENVELQLDEYKRRIFDELEGNLRNLGDVNDWIERERQGNIRILAPPNVQ